MSTTGPHPASDPYMRDSAEIAQARADGRAIVALESTIVAHGMPYPQNLETARAVEAVVRREGAVPATIAVLDGVLRIGLADAQLEALARGGREVMKLSRRDLPYALASGRMGATTVAATMVAAQRAGIEVFVTGGIGGVHRGAATSLDISADLQELARTSVAVVCAGAKSVLDLPLTLEYLETHGVPVIGVGQLAFAAFYMRDSGLLCDARIDEPAQQALYLRIKWALGLQGGVVFSNPVPQAEALPREIIEALTQQALDEASAQGVAGKALTPFLLARLQQLSGGASLRANIALVKHNAEVGARLALALTAARRAQG